MLKHLGVESTSPVADPERDSQCFCWQYNNFRDGNISLVLQQRAAEGINHAAFFGNALTVVRFLNNIVRLLLEISTPAPVTIDGGDATGSAAYNDLEPRFEDCRAIKKDVSDMMMFHTYNITLMPFRNSNQIDPCSNEMELR